MTLKERIQAYCQYKGISVSQFERQAGLSNGYFKEGSKCLALTESLKF